MTLRSYAIAITVLAVIVVGVVVGGSLFVGGSGEHFFGQDRDE